MNSLLIAQLGLIIVVFHALLLSAAGMVWVERRLAALLQQRLGPVRVGWQGLLQPFADVIKLMFKEELRPKAADAVLFSLAPIISAACAFAAFAVVPFGGTTTLQGLIPEGFPLQVADVNVAVLVVFAIASMSVYGIVLAGWSSNSKYALLGGLRSSAQMISYELSYGMALAAVLLIGNSLSLTDLSSLAWVFAATAFIALVGAIDDIWTVGVVPRLALQAAAVGLVIAALPSELRVLPSLLPWWIERALLVIAGDLGSPEHAAPTRHARLPASSGRALSAPSRSSAGRRRPRPRWRASTWPPAPPPGARNP